MNDMINISIGTVILFFLYIWGLGFSITRIVKESNNFYERNIMRIGIGLALFVVLGVLLNFLRISLDWKIFLIVSLIVPLYTFVKIIIKKKIKLPKHFSITKLNLTKSNLTIFIVLLIFAVSFFMYTTGSFSYPYFEDDDPWAHALGIKYVATEKSSVDPGYGFHYIDPYPPGYGVLMGILHQTSSSLMWTLKFFNSLIISLGIVFFYFFALKFTRSRNKALFATFVLAALPSYFTHFIWAHTLVVTLFFPAMYCLEKIKDDKKWKFVAMFAIASIILVQHSQALKLGIMLLAYLVIKSLYEKKFLKDIFIAQIGGLLISLLWWLKRGLAEFGRMINPVTNSVITATDSVTNSISSNSLWTKITTTFPADSGTATRAYTFKDFFFAQPYGGINVHVGWGVFVTILIIIALIYTLFRYQSVFKKENSWLAITLFWFIFTFLGVNAMTFNLPIGLITFRFWLILAIPAALLAAEGFFFLKKLIGNTYFGKIVLVIVIVIGVLATSGYQKYQHNTLPNWPPGGRWTSMDEMQGYLWLKDLPANTRVFDFSTAGDKVVVSYDQYTCAWCPETQELRNQLLNISADELHSWLKTYKYEYVVFGGMSFRYLEENFPVEEVSEKLPILINGIANSQKFTLAHQTAGMAVFKVN